MNVIHKSLGIALLTLAAAIPGFPQGTDLGTIRGTVTDISGAVVPKADIQITDLATNSVRKLSTNTEGNYEAAGLRYGDYKVSVAAAGFSGVEITGISLRAGDIVRADARLKPATASTTVMITAEAPQIETESPTIGSTLDNLEITELPRDSRDIYSFLYLNPNVAQGAGDGSFKYLGAQSYGASFALDGQRSNGGIFGEPTSSQPSLEAVGELDVLTNNFTAEYAGVANIRVQTKRGTSAFHGSTFYNNKNSALAAWNFRDKIAQSSFLPTPAQSSYPTPYFNLNEFGGSLGGPVPKVKNTYFLFAYERRWSDAPVYLRSTTLPGPRLWTGDFAQLADARKPAVPAAITLTAAEVAANTVGGQGKQFISIPQRLLNPVTAALIQKYFPQVNPNQPINPTNGRLIDFFDSKPGLTTRNLGTVRLDHNFNEKNVTYLVYNVSNQDSATSAVVNPYEGLGLTQNSRLNHTVSLSYTHLFGTRIVNEARGGFNIQNSFRRSNQTLRQFLTGIGFNDADIAAYGAVVGPTALDTYGHPAINFGTGLANFTNGGRNTFRPLDQSLATFGDTLNWMKGRHTLKFGADLVRNAATDGFANNRGNPRGLIRYGGTGPDAFARFLMGLPADSVQFVSGLRPPAKVYNWEQGYFVQDDFKVNSHLTLNLGVRYEIISPFTEANDILANFDPTYISPTGKKGRFVIPSQSTLALLDPRILSYGYVIAGDIGLPRSLVHTDYSKVAPRLGAAWRIGDKMVIRGGYGFFFPTSAAQGMRDAMATNPFNQGRTATAGAAAPLSPWPGFAHGFSPMTGGTINRLGGTPSFNTLPFDLKEPRIEQFSVTFEREIGWKTTARASYLGTRMHNLITGRDLNMLAPNNTPFGTTTGDGVTACEPSNFNCDYSDADLARQPFPTLGDYMASYGNFGRGRSDALQLEARRRFSGGLEFNATYMLIRQKATAVDSANASLGGTAYNQFQPENDYSIDSWIPRHRFIAYSIYQLPVGRGRKYGNKMSGWLDKLAGSWQTSMQMFIKSGTGFTPFWICDDCGPAAPGNIGSAFLDAVGDFNGNSYRPFVVGDPMKKSGNRIWDPAAFTVPGVGADVLDNPAVARRNSLLGPGTWGVNLGINKSFRFGERVRANLGADFNNLFNHPLFSPDQGGESIANLGNFSIHVDPVTKRILPITDITPNPDFGRLLTSYSQEGIDSRRTVRLKLRITF